MAETGNLNLSEEGHFPNFYSESRQGQTPQFRTPIKAIADSRLTIADCDRGLHDSGFPDCRLLIVDWPTSKRQIDIPTREFMVGRADFSAEPLARSQASAPIC